MPDNHACCICGSKIKATWSVRAGRFGIAPDQLTCDVHLLDTIKWLLHHPNLMDSDRTMFEVRPL